MDILFVTRKARQDFTQRFKESARIELRLLEMRHQLSEFEYVKELAKAMGHDEKIEARVKEMREIVSSLLASLKADIL